jgi:hypothetical protein
MSGGLVTHARVLCRMRPFTTRRSWGSSTPSVRKRADDNRTNSRRDLGDVAASNQVEDVIGAVESIPPAAVTWSGSRLWLLGLTAPA